jgi:phospholipase/carboxylesterase
MRSRIPSSKFRIPRFHSRITRRQFTAAGGSALVSLLFENACGASSAQVGGGRLAARPRQGVTTSLESGPLGLGRGDRDGVIQMPSAKREGALPLLVFLHGATQNGAGMLRRIGATADQLGIAVLAPDSRRGTWDAIGGGFGEDVAFLDRALEVVFARLQVDPAHLAIGGFSDGASYALSLALANGSLFPRVVACSPGFVTSAPPEGRPRFFVSHGTADQILPIDQCSRVIVPRLRAMGYDVAYREFEGRHELPADVLGEALRWMTA